VPHHLILGMTESGKTTHGKALSKEYRSQGIETIVLDPNCDPGWQASFQTADPNEFLRVFWKSKSCAVFIDEGAEVAGRYDTAMQITATKGRHWGHNVHYVCQGATGLAPIIRGQCSRLSLFTMNGEAIKILEREFNKDLKAAANFPPGTYIYCGRYTDPKIFKMF